MTTPEPHTSRAQDSPGQIDRGEPCRCGRPSWSRFADLAFELQAKREELDALQPDLVELLAARMALAYRHLGGRTMSTGAWRAVAREVVSGSRERG